MLFDPDLEGYDNPSRCVFDMWEIEKATGDPRNSLYIGRDNHA